MELLRILELHLAKMRAAAGAPAAAAEDSTGRPNALQLLLTAKDEEGNALSQAELLDQVTTGWVVGSRARLERKKKKARSDKTGRPTLHAAGAYAALRRPRHLERGNVRDDAVPGPQPGCLPSAAGGAGAGGKGTWGGESFLRKARASWVETDQCEPTRLTR